DKDYLGNSPSTNFQKTKPITVKNFNQLYEKSAKVEDYSEMEHALTPHSWSFIGARGTQLGVSTQNYLNTISINAAIGEGVNEDGLFGNLSLSFKKYYPILSLLLDYQERANEIDQWSEASVGAGVTLPYTFKSGLYNGGHSLTFIANQIEVSNRRTQRIYELDSDQLFSKSIIFNTSFLKEMRFRELRPSKGVSFEAQYVDAQASEDESFSSYLAYSKLNLYTPGFDINHGFLLSLSSEYRMDDPFTYRITSPAESINEYAFSRGFDFEYVADWQKVSLNYILPISYPNKSFGRWLYFNRIYTNLYFDHTKTSTPRSLNSFGAEAFFESLTLRKIPLTYGLRYINRLEHGDARVELLFNLDVAY
ncbi:MAG: hypothetical protein KC478_11950, partial [Bacteriovoracaceae bacterium]|nr:hypothetical protein [Bacteriovoracaceae bacterium]